MRVRGKGQWTQAQCEREGSWLRKYPNRRLYDIRSSTYVRLGDPDIRARLLAGERVLGAQGCASDVTAEVLAGLVVSEVAAGRITAERLRALLNEVAEHGATIDPSRAGSVAGLV